MILVSYQPEPEFRLRARIPVLNPVPVVPYAWSNGLEAKELDMSDGPRFCKRCNYEAEDGHGYVLDTHFWSEHDKEENESISCKICDEMFPALPELMRHKKKYHIEKVNFCWNFSTDSCIHMGMGS